MRTEDVAAFVVAMLASPFRIPVAVTVPKPRRTS
jgi:hypothetical protein